MLIIGCDFHTRYQQMAMLDEATGELIERHLDHASGETQAFYRELQGPVRVGTRALCFGPHSQRRTLCLYAEYSVPKSEARTRSSGIIWKR